MQAADLLTPDMIDAILPLFGFSIVLNVVLLAALIFRPLYQRFLDQARTAKIGIQMVLNHNDQPSQRS